MSAHNSIRRIGSVIVGFALLASALAACSTPSNSSTSDNKSGPFTVVLSNNNAAISWRQQMMNQVHYLADTKYSKTVKYSLKLSDSSVSAQIASVQQIIRQKPDALLIDAASDTALDNVLNQACKAGIVVVNFDEISTGVGCSQKISSPAIAQATDGANWMCAQLNGKGSVLLDQAVAGLPIPTAQNAAIRKVFSTKCPDVKIVGTYQSGYAPGPEKQAVASLLTSNPNVTGVMSLAYCSSVTAAFKAAGRTPVPSTCVGSNGNMVSCATDKVPCFQWAASPVMGAIALETAVNVLKGHKVSTADTHPIAQEYVQNSTVTYAHTLKKIVPVSGKDYFPSASPDLILPQTFSDFNITPSIAMTGK